MRRTLRMRLALLYGGVFFVTGALLLAFVFGLFWGGQSTRVSTPAGQGTPGGRSVVDHQHGIDLHALLIASAIGLAITVVVSLAFGWIIAGRALRPLHTMVMTAQAISARNLDSRIGLDSPYAEFKELASTLDDLFGRLEAAFTSQRNFVANASHELRTPLTAERALLQVTLADPNATTETLRSACQELLALGAAQERLIESLLTLASSEQAVERWEPLDIGAIAADVILVRQAEAERRGVRIDAALAEAVVTGDPRLVESLVANLVDNAIQHNVPGGCVHVATSRSEQGACVIVRNTGPVIPPRDVDRLFVPFQRLRIARVGHPDGHGLGLAIVRAITAAHGAVLTANAPQTGGLEIQVAFPPQRPEHHPASPFGPGPARR